MSIVINTKMPINCEECHSMGTRNLNDCQLIFSGCANCGRHPNCPLVDIEDIKAEIEKQAFGVKSVYNTGLRDAVKIIDRFAIPLDNVVKLPKDEVVYGYISKQFPTTNVFFDSYATALNSATHDQPKHRPFYMIKATRHFEFCGIVEKDKVKGDKE